MDSRPLTTQCLLGLATTPGVSSGVSPSCHFLLASCIAYAYVSKNKTIQYTCSLILDSQTKREVELIEGFREATPGEAEKGGAKEDLKEVELQWKKKSSAPSAPHPAAAVTPSSLFSQQRLQGRHDVLTGLALDSAATLQLRQCTR